MIKYFCDWCNEEFKIELDPVFELFEKKYWNGFRTYDKVSICEKCIEKVKKK